VPHVRICAGGAGHRPPFRDSLGEHIKMAPVFHGKARHLLKIVPVAREHERLLPQGNRGNFQIHRPDSRALLPQPFKRRCRVLVKGQNLPRRKECDQTEQPLVIGDLPLDGRDTVDQC
jgi:hypothetical protein